MTVKLNETFPDGTVITNGRPPNWNWSGQGCVNNWYSNRNTNDPSTWAGWYNPVSEHPDGGGCLQIGGGGRGIHDWATPSAGWFIEFTPIVGKVYTVTCDIMVYTPTYRTNTFGIGTYTLDTGHNIIETFNSWSSMSLCNTAWKTIPVGRSIVTNATGIHFRFCFSMSGSTEADAFVRVKNISVLESDEEDQSRSHFAYSGTGYDVWSDYSDYDTKTYTTVPTGDISTLSFKIAKHERCMTQLCVRPTAQWNNAKITSDGLTDLEVNWRYGVFQNIHNSGYSYNPPPRGRTSPGVMPLVSAADFVIPADTTSVFYVDIYAPPSVAAGTYTGNLYIQDGATVKATIPVSIVVRPYCLTVKNSERVFRNFYGLAPETGGGTIGRYGNDWTNYGGETPTPEKMKQYWKEVFEVGYGAADFGCMTVTNYPNEDLTQANNPLLYAMAEFLAATGYDMPCSAGAASDQILDNGNFQADFTHPLTRFDTGTANIPDATRTVASAYYSRIYEILGGPWFSYIMEERDLKTDYTTLSRAQSTAWQNLKKTAAPGLETCGTGKISDEPLADGLLNTVYVSAQIGDNFLFVSGATSYTKLGFYINTFQGSNAVPQLPLWHWQMLPVAYWAWGSKGGLYWWNVTSWNGATTPHVDKNPWYDTTPYNVTIGAPINLFYPPDSGTSGYADYTNTPTPAIHWRHYCLGVGFVMHLELLQKLIDQNKGTAAQRAAAQACLDSLRTDLVPAIPFANKIDTNLFAVRDYAAFETIKDEIATHIETLTDAPAFYKGVSKVPDAMSVMLLDVDYVYSQNDTLAHLAAHEVSGGGAVSFTYANKAVTISDLTVDSGVTPFGYVALVSATVPCLIYPLTEALAGKYKFTFGSIATSK